MVFRYELPSLPDVASKSMVTKFLAETTLATTLKGSWQPSRNLNIGGGDVMGKKKHPQYTGGDVRRSQRSPDRRRKYK